MFTNIAAYKFATLSDLKSLRERLIARCKALGLKGTILLSTEGINLFIAGLDNEVQTLLAELRGIAGLESLTPKVSLSEEQPFRRMLVRIKREIISFGVEGIEPAKYTSPRVEARQLKQWLDEGKKVTLLDTRNDYEVKLGTFKGAVVPDIASFRDFPRAVAELPAAMKDEVIVTFCTGGIRCEKAAPFLEREGFQHVYQLEGGILKYFEECGNAHYDGECFVFDQRVGVDPSLQETESTQCFTCQTPLNEADQRDERYVQGESCPYCFKTSHEQMIERIAEREAAMRAASTPLPGSVPYVNERPFSVPARLEGATLLDCLCALMPHIAREEWLTRLEQGRFLSQHRERVHAMQIVRAGERYIQVFPATSEPDVNMDVHILHEDEALLVLIKPAPLPMHPCGRFNRNTLMHLLHEVYAPEKPRFAHRLDASTTGLVICARTRHFAGKLSPQFKRGGVEKTYLVRVHGHPEWDTHRCELPIGEESVKLGARDIDEDEGEEAITEFTVKQRCADGSALLEARPITGRTNQIRLHLWELGSPVVGDRVYLPDHARGDTQTLSLTDAPLCLHAWKIAFDHPLSGERLRFETSVPSWWDHQS